MKLNRLSKIKDRKKKRKGRGYGSGKGGHTTGSGQKGQRSRSGYKRVKSWIRESQISSMPKLRGIGKRSTKGKYRKSLEFVINVGDLNKYFKNGDVIDEKILKKVMINYPKSKEVSIKILGLGKLHKKFTIKGLRISKNAGEKIKKAGGKIL